MKYCTNCGNKLEQEDVCLKCGRIIKEPNRNLKKEKKNGFFWIVSLVCGVLSLFSLGACFFHSGFFYFSLPMMVCAIVFGVFGFFEKSRLNLIGFLMGIFVFLCMVVLVIIGLQEIFHSNITGNWILEDDSMFQINGEEETCYWIFGLDRDNSDYYQGICSYEKASVSEENVLNYDENTFVLYMKIETVKYDNEIYEAGDYLEVESPYFVFYIYFDETLTMGEFYNPTSGVTRMAYKEELWVD